MTVGDSAPRTDALQRRSPVQHLDSSTLLELCSQQFNESYMKYHIRGILGWLIIPFCDVFFASQHRGWTYKSASALSRPQDASKEPGRMTSKAVFFAKYQKNVWQATLSSTDKIQFKYLNIKLNTSISVAAVFGPTSDSSPIRSASLTLPPLLPSLPESCCSSGTLS